MSRDNAELNLTNAWVQVSDDALPFCSVTLLGALPAVVRLSRTKPDAGINEGFPLSALNRFWSANDIAAPQKAWARAAIGSARVTIN